MRKTFFTLLFILSYFLSYAIADKNYIITLAINPKDCNSCKEVIHDLSKLKDDFYLQILFPENLKKDSTYLNNSLKLNTLVDTLIWNDLLYKEYTSKGTSVVAVESIHKTGRFTESISNLYKNGFLEFLHGQKHEIKELFAAYPLISKNMEHYLYTSDGLLFTYSVNGYKIEVYNYIKQEKQYTIEIERSARKKVFAYNTFGISEKEYDEQEKIFKDRNYAINDILYVGDTLFVFLKTNYIRRTIKADSTFSDNLVKDISLIKYKNGKLLSTHKIENVKRIKDEGDYIFKDLVKVHYYAGRIYGQIVSINNKQGELNGKKPTLAKFIMDKNGVYKMQILKEDAFLNAHPGRYNFLLNAQFADNVYKTIKSNKLIDLETAEIVDILPFYTDYEDLRANVLPAILTVDYGIKKNKDFIWSIAKDKKQVYFYKMSRKNKRFIEKKMELPQGINNMHIRFDPLNPDFVIYNNGNKIIRKKIF